MDVPIKQQKRNESNVHMRRYIYVHILYFFRVILFNNIASSSIKYAIVTYIFMYMYSTSSTHTVYLYHYIRMKHFHGKKRQSDDRVTLYLYMKQRNPKLFTINHL